MQCTRPIILSGVELPCGKCIGCKIAKSRDWTARIMQELDYYPASCFMTLTYNEASLPEGSTLVKKDLQKFVKRIRKNTRKDIKYFGCGEYGDPSRVLENGYKTVGDRPHYHIIMLGVGVNWEGINYLPGKKGKAEVKEWTNGYVHVGTVEQDSVRYVTDYVMKKYDGLLATETYGQKERPFRIVSQGFGKRYCLKYAEKLKEREWMTLRDVRLGLPRYYRDILGIKNPIYTDLLRERAYWVRLDMHVSLREKTGSLKEKDYQDCVNRIRLQFEKNYEAKIKLRRTK